MPCSARYLSFIGTLSIGLLAASSLPTLADILMIQGSTTFNSSLFKPYLANIETAAGHTLAVVPNKSSEGLLALLNGQADLAMISTSLESEISLLQKANPNLPFARLRTFPVYETRAAFAVNPSNSVRSTSIAMMRRILLGDISNWRILGGADLPLKIVMVRDGGGVQLSVQTALLEKQLIKPHDLVAVGISRHVVEVVAKEPGPSD
jgi:phosphate transport system substrate-binding protein